MSRLHVSAQSIVLVPATPISSESKRGVSSKHSFLCAPFVAPQPHIPLSITAAPQILDLMNTLANASGPHVEEIIKALKALPQCIKASAEATKMSTITKVAKKERAKQGKGKGPKRPLNSWMAYRSMLLQTLSPFFWILLTLLRVLQPNA
jgi:hypothetical protein